MLCVLSSDYFELFILFPTVSSKQDVTCDSKPNTFVERLQQCMSFVVPWKKHDEMVSHPAGVDKLDL